MPKMISFRTKVFNRATKMRLETGKHFDVCLMVSWKVYHLIQRMKKGNVRFAYEKLEDGSLRYATGTLKGIPDGAIKNGEYRDRDWHKHYKTIPYWDVEAGEFRSFKPHLFIKAYDEDEPTTNRKGINIEVAGCEGDGSLTTSYIIAELLKEAGLKVNIHVPQKDVNIDYGMAKTRGLSKSKRLLKDKVVNVTYSRKRKYNKNES